MKTSDIKVGIRWNIISYAILGIFTMLSYCLITWYYGEAFLGVYNIMLSIFMLSGHIGVFGLQSASIYYIPRQLGDKVKLSQNFFSFLIIVIFAGVIVAGIIFWSSETIGRIIFRSEYISRGLRCMAPAVILFSVNKLIAGYINGMGKMRQFALLQSTRYFLIVAYITVVVIFRLSFTFIFWTFGVSEAGVMVMGIIFLHGKVFPKMPQKEFICSGFRFGSQAMLGNIISDVNTRIDIMMLGALCGDSAVGLYSFVSVIAEGVISILFVFRSNFNPHFAELLFHKKIDDLALLFKQQKKRLVCLFGILSFMILIGYITMCLLFLEKSFMKSIPSVLLVLCGCSIMAPYFVGGNICSLYGKPVVDTGITLLTIIFNAIFNYLLIPQLYLTGAALSTCISYLIFSVLTFGAIKRILKSIA